MTVVVKKVCVSCNKRPAAFKVGNRNLCAGCYASRMAAIAKIKEGKQNATKQ